MDMSKHLRLAIRVFLLVVVLVALVYVRRNTPAAATGTEDPTMVQPHYVGKLRFLALGDSYTIGESVEAADRWPNQLAARVRKSGIDLSDPLILAKTGWTTGDLLGAMDRAKLGDQYDLVMLLIGVNNQYQGRSEDEYRRDFVTLLKRAIALAGGKENHVVILSIPDWGVTPFGHSSDQERTAKQIDEFNAINFEETAKTKAAYVDVTPASRQCTTQPDLVAEDGLHPSGKQYGLWVEKAAGAVQSILAGSH
jgi:lysophospholipase L1-like esterase